MMLMGGPKRLAAVIVASKKEPPKSSSMAMEVLKKMKESPAIEISVKKPEPNDVDAYKEAVLSQAKAVLKAIDKKDPERLAIVLKDFISMCREDGDEEGEEEGES